MCNLAVFVPLGLCILNDSAVSPVKPSAEGRWKGVPDEGLFNDGATVNGKVNACPRGGYALRGGSPSVAGTTVSPSGRFSRYGCACAQNDKLYRRVRVILYGLTLFNQTKHTPMSLRGGSREIPRERNENKRTRLSQTLARGGTPPRNPIRNKRHATNPRQPACPRGGTPPQNIIFYLKSS